MNFVFEKIVEDLPLNLTNCTELLKSGIGRITVSPVVSTLHRCLRVEAHLYRSIVDKVHFLFKIPEGQKYIIPVGVAHSPYDWCGPDSANNGYDKNYPDRKSLFEYISKDYLKDMQEGRAFLLIDQTHEGYQTTWLWDWFHNTCKTYGVAPRQIIYITGNMDCSDQYDQWFKDNNPESKMLVIPLPHFENVVNEISLNYNAPHHHLPPGLAEKRKLPSFQDHLEYKTHNIENISMFNILQKRPRAYRLWLFKHLYDTGLIDGNIISMNKFDFENTYFEGKKMTKEDVDEMNEILPILPKDSPINYTVNNFESPAGGDFISFLNDKIMLDSWCTIVSEASYGDHEVACFLSEKTFKPIACQHPFIIFGSKNSIKHLQNMGYKTFHPFIDESYDQLPTWERMDAVVNEMLKLQSMTPIKRLEWFKNLEPILNHNFEILRTRSKKYVEDKFKILNDHVGV